nr:unnamed protein product [Callosobruchus chinensis]
MPYNYKRLPGSRRYADYSNDQLLTCLEAIRSGDMTQRQAADYFKIPRSTIKNKLKNLFPSSPGHPKVFAQEEELAFASHIDKMCEYGFPLNELDLRYIVKTYLTRQGRNYIENLKEGVKDVSPDKIYNYDETCMSDDPGRKKVICRRGCKYPERIMNSTKKQEGTKVVIGDNLSSHVNLSVLKLCEENDIKFICLPPNSSHLTQPLDLAYFRPLKIKWRQVLTEWKQSESGKLVPTLPKDIFPRLLKKALDNIEPHVRENIKAGFKKAGIHPISKDEVLKRLPSSSASVNLELVGETFIQHLKEKDRKLLSLE